MMGGVVLGCALAAALPGAAAAAAGRRPAPTDLDRVVQAVGGVESSHGTDPRMWRADPRGPQGPMQVSAAAAADVGGGDRFDSAANRALGRAYLALMRRRFGSWADAVTAYNWGPARLNAWIANGRSPDRMPFTVSWYRYRVLSAAGLAAARGGLFGQPAGRRRLGIAHAQPHRRYRDRRADAAVARLYAEIMHASLAGRRGPD